MNNKALIDALRAVLPYAVERVDQLRRTCAFAVSVVSDAGTLERIVERAEAATHVVTAARLALQDADAAAHHLNCHVAYNVTLRASLGGRWAAHEMRVMAECADDAQAEALRCLEAAGISHGDVLHVRRVVA